jgi:hypothetical protein
MAAEERRGGVASAFCQRNEVAMNKSDILLRELSAIARAPYRAMSGEVPAAPSQEILRFGGRTLLLQSPAHAVVSWRHLGLRFAALLPANELADLQEIESRVRELRDHGCCEIATFGPFAEELHDMIDDVLLCGDDSDRTVSTTWHEDPVDAAYWFVHLAGGTARDVTLLAFVPPHSGLAAMLHGEIRKVA